jgi:hypothetical protein
VTTTTEQAAANSTTSQDVVPANGGRRLGEDAAQFTRTTLSHSMGARNVAPLVNIDAGVV